MTTTTTRRLQRRLQWKTRWLPLLLVIGILLLISPPSSVQAQQYDDYGDYGGDYGDSNNYQDDGYGGDGEQPYQDVKA